jgi:hypothetical protein
MLVSARVTPGQAEYGSHFGIKDEVLPTIVVINFAQGSDLVWPTGTSENLFLYLSASAAECFSKTAHFDVELRKSG